MNKKLLSMAVAAALVAPTAAMAEAVLYGDLHVSIDWFDIEDVRAPNGTVIQRGYQGWGLNGGGSSPDTNGLAPAGSVSKTTKGNRDNQIGLKGSEDLGNGMEAIYHVQFDIHLTEESNSNVLSGGDEFVTMQKAYVGLSSKDFGTVMVGRNDSPLYTSTSKLDLFENTMADYNEMIGFDDNRFDNAIAYVSPSMGGFQLAGALEVGGGSTGGAGENLNSNSLGEGFALAGVYSNGPFYASLAYESQGKELQMGTAVSNNELSANYVEEEYSIWRVGVGLMNWNGFTVTGIYERQNIADTDKFTRDVDATWDLWQLQAGYSFGNSMVKAMYGFGEYDYDALPGTAKVSSEHSAWSLAFDHNFTKRTKAYVLYTQYDSDQDVGGVSLNSLEWDGFSVGMVHHF